MTKNELSKNHKSTIKEIKEFLSSFDENIKDRIFNFKNSLEFQNYRSERVMNGYKKWANDVKIRFHNRCLVCQSNSKLVAHHLNSYKYFPELRTNINNGICLCSSCHINFHDLYGNRNVSSQFFEYTKLLKNEKVASLLKGCRSSTNINILSNSLKKNGYSFELMEFNHLTLLIKYYNYKNLKQKKVYTFYK